MLFAHPSMKTTEYVWINLCLCSSKTGGRRISACRPGGFLSLVLRHERLRQQHWDEPVPHPHGCSVQHAGFLSFDLSHLCACSPPPTIIPDSVATTFPAGCSHHPVSFSYLLHACLSLPSPIPCNLPPCLNPFFTHRYSSANQVPFTLYLILHLFPPSIYLHVHQLHSTPPLILSLPACRSASCSSCMSFNWQALLPFSLALSLSPPCQS